jgi:adenylate cyclase
VASARETSLRSRRFILICGAIPALAVAIMALSRPAFVFRFDNGLYDQMLRWTGSTTPSDRVVIVDIDERSLASYGQWPWARDVIARLVARLRDARAAVVALDIMFPEPDRSGESADVAFANTLRGGGVILGYGLMFDLAATTRHQCVLHPFSTAVVQRADVIDASPFFQATSAVCSMPLLAQAANASGFMNGAPDSDGILRRVPLLVELDGRVYPNLALAAVSAVTNARDALMQVSNDNRTTLTLGERQVPLDGKSNLLLRFRGEKHTFPYLSAADILDGRIGSEAIADRIVFVGTTALGTREVVATPLDTLFVGVEVQATVADNLLEDAFIRRPEYPSGIESLVTLTSGAAVAVLIATCGFSVGVPLAAAGLAALWAAAVWLLDTRGLFISPLLPTLGCATVFAVVSLARFRLERKRADTAGVESSAARALLIQGLLSLTEMRDAETGRHSRRTQEYVKLLAQELSGHPRFRDELTADRIELLSSLAPLHDIGKVGVPDRILNKPGALTPEELVEMRRHPVYGRDVILNAERKALVRDDTVLSLAKEIVYTHHERWDGTGYPEGLAGEHIPVAGRILAVVDVYDATTSRTLYGTPMSHDKALATIVSCRGSHFDPAVVDAFERVAPAFAAFSEQPRAEAAARV